MRVAFRTLSRSMPATPRSRRSRWNAGGKLETFRDLEIYGYRLILSGLHPAVDNLIKLVVELRSDSFQSLIKRLDHPVVQARAADYMIRASEPRDHRKPLQWITKDSCDALVALAIVHSLNTVDRLDADLRHTKRANTDRSKLSTELCPAHDCRDAEAAELPTGLVDRLAVLGAVGVRAVDRRAAGQLAVHASSRW